MIVKDADAAVNFLLLVRALLRMKINRNEHLKTLCCPQMRADSYFHEKIRVELSCIFLSFPVHTFRLCMLGRYLSMFNRNWESLAVTQKPVVSAIVVSWFLSKTCPPVGGLETSQRRIYTSEHHLTRVAGVATRSDSHILLVYPFFSFFKTSARYCSASFRCHHHAHC